MLGGNTRKWRQTLTMSLISNVNVCNVYCYQLHPGAVHVHFVDVQLLCSFGFPVSDGRNETNTIGFTYCYVMYLSVPRYLFTSIGKYEEEKATSLDGATSQIMHYSLGSIWVNNLIELWCHAAYEIGFLKVECFILRLYGKQLWGVTFVVNFQWKYD